MNELRLPCGRETRKLVWALFLGQVVSLLLALGSLASSLIADLGVDAPLSQSLFAYVLLAVVCGGIMLYRRQRLLVGFSIRILIQRIYHFICTRVCFHDNENRECDKDSVLFFQVPWYWYLLLGFVDVQGNYLFNKAYQYSSITSITLLDCFTIAWVIGLTRIFLGTRYSLWQVLGAAICVVGLGLVLLSDAGVAGGGGSRPLLGDVLVIGATFFYASSNVSEEFFVKKKDLVELIAMLGLFGAVVSICEICIFEIKSLESVAWSTEIILAGCGYTLTTFLFYILMPLVMQLHGAALFNLSILTSDMWAVIFRIFFYHQKVDWLYFLSFATVAVGLVIYSTTGKDPDPVPVNGLDAQYQIINDEAENVDP